MNFDIVKHEQLSGKAANIYTIKLKGDEDTLLEQFAKENFEKYREEVQTILLKLKSMGHDTGCESNFFEHNEGKSGDGIVALKCERLRLYCMYFRDTLIICGSGGYKSPDIRAYQEDSELNAKVDIMKGVAAKINESIRKNEIEIEKDGTLTFYTEDYGNNE